MTNQEIAFNIKRKIDTLPRQYDSVTEQMLYQQGILLGLLATLSLHDSRNYEIVQRSLKDIKTEKGIE